VGRIDPATGPGSKGETTMRVTKTLLACGVVAGPLYVLVSLTEALTRDATSPTWW
jgi:hypothetical protein